MHDVELTRLCMYLQFLAMLSLFQCMHVISSIDDLGCCSL
jgi:hypothetical protein